ncbi:hypothetical protein [Corallococcus sp. AS-1-12]|uniref:hypothetical protein n=1 Tax=Corallococcus sp. AS-1-12 TaxID=2874598 RepID=UPI001CBE9CC5|nr:hypothetical protein [Corallococcus sp. AS-1-12]MBZ4336097.1 hypothetical protein [Corallococcus sp. AS-1-12]
MDLMPQCIHQEVQQATGQNLSWRNRFRRLLVRWEKREDTYVAMLHFALVIITWFHSRKSRYSRLLKKPGLQV